MFKETGGHGARVKRVGEGVQHEAQRQPAGRPSSGNPKYGGKKGDGVTKPGVLRFKIQPEVGSVGGSPRTTGLPSKTTPLPLFPYLTALIRNEINDMSG